MNESWLAALGMAAVPSSASMAFALSDDMGSCGMASRCVCHPNTEGDGLSMWNLGDFTAVRMADSAGAISAETMETA